MAHPSRLQAARLAAGLTQHELARRLGVQQVTVSRWETGGVDPVVRTAVKVARAVGSTVEEVWGGQEKERVPRR